MSETISIRRDFDNNRDMIHLPNVSYIDTQVWSVDIGLDRKELVDLYQHIGLWLDATGEAHDEL